MSCERKENEIHDQYIFLMDNYESNWYIMKSLVEISRVVNIYNSPDTTFATILTYSDQF